MMTVVAGHDRAWVALTYYLRSIRFQHFSALTQNVYLCSPPPRSLAVGPAPAVLLVGLLDPAGLSVLQVGRDS